MLDGWYCRNQMATGGGEQQPQTESDEEDKSSEEDESLSRLNQKSIDHKAQYQNLKKKLKYLLYVSCCDVAGVNEPFFFYKFLYFFCLYL